eukprot:TRINITY_DN870_c0_g1_i2.p1 TRINITY_DN870_c0_g1~~TRINITY_DN870_c0_g1_i2.p1  ORF type:complete len:466 (-),score=106.50 TRINITY_DN870_c0_g1_i2:30-1403(-)
MAANKTLIFQLGTNNWQREGEFAPGSGILHEAHHFAYKSFENTGCYSIYPSKVQTSDPTETDVIVFQLDHDIPICESISPVSSYRWHAMSDEEFNAYRERLENTVYDFMAKAEEEEGMDFTLAIAHHTFLNPLALRNVLRRRESEGKAKVPLVCFVHGTALKMYIHEMKGENTEEFPLRFLPLLQQEKVFDDLENGVSLCYAISGEQVNTLAKVFPEFPTDRVVISPNGINGRVFYPREGVSLNEVLSKFTTTPYEGSDVESIQIPGEYDHMVLFIGKFADWKRQDALLRAAAIYEGVFEEKGKKVATIIVGSGPLENQKLYQDMAVELGLQHTYYIGPHPQPVLAELASVASVGCFPSKNEPFGMVFIECMGCGTPVIGANSGGPKDFVSDSVGLLVDETDDIDELAHSLSDAVVESIEENWKESMKEACLKLVEEKYSVEAQCSNLLKHTFEMLG